MKVYAISTKKFYTDGPGVVTNVFSTFDKALTYLIAQYPNAAHAGLIEGVWHKYEDVCLRTIIYITEYDVL